MLADRMHGRPGAWLPSAGFSLIELLVALTVLGALLAIALPSFAEWIRNNQVRSAAESLRDGLQLARSEAVKRNTRVRLQLVSTLDASCALNTTGPYWIVNAGASVSPAGACNAVPGSGATPFVLQASPATSGATRVVLAASVSTTAFEASGRQATTLNPVTSSASSPFSVDIRSTAGLCLPAGNVRCLRVVLSAAGQVRMCDPVVASSDPARC